MTTRSAEPERLKKLSEHVANHAAGALGVLLAYIGDQLGLYRTLAATGPMSSLELAEATGTNERYVREWLSANAAGGYVEYDGATDKFSMTPEQMLLFADEGKPGAMQGLFQSIVSTYLDEPENTKAFRTGDGIPWAARNICCYCGTERFFRPMYEANLLDQWLPSLDGIEEKLKKGAVIADVGCGRGLPTLIMARTFPKSVFHGFDYHRPSIEEATKKSREADLSNARFEIADAKSFPKRSYDLVAIFDALHDMGDPVGVARYILSTLKPDGTLMLVEPRAGDKLDDNLHPLGQLFYCFSTLICTAVSRSQEVGLALGAQAGPKRLTQVLNEAGFSQVRLTAQSDTNIVLEARNN